MLAFLRGLRSFGSFLLVALYFVLGSLWLRLLVLPGSWLFPHRRFELISWYMKPMAAGIMRLLSLGGARFRRIGTIPTREPALIVANHQSLLDILQITVLARPYVPAFVTRERYARFVPLVSASIRQLACPVIDPHRDPVGAIDEIRRAARDLPHGLLIFPEGHRSRDGEILPFRPNGFVTIMRERRTPVWLVLNDGVSGGSHLTDLLFRVHRTDAVSEVMGPFEPPVSDEELPGFLRELRQRLCDRLAEHRAAAGRPAKTP